MERTLTRMMAGVLAFGCAVSTAYSARGVLNADGILSIKGAPEGTARVTVMPHDKPAYTLPQGLHRFILNLELDNTFLVTFEQEGCVTKQLYFDTTVPAEKHDGEFFFPFKVTLENPGHAGAFTYAGPVGFIRYHAEITDFGYDTDYTIKVDESFHERMAVLKSTGVDPHVPIATPLSATVVTTTYHRPGEPAPEPEVTYSEGKVAPIASEVPPLVHPTGDPSSSIVARAPSTSVPIARASIDPVAFRSPEPVADTPELAEPIGMDEPAVASAPLLDTAPITLEAEGAWGREEELFVEGSRIIKIVRIHDPQGHSTEYRRVTHKYGGIFFFKDGYSVPEHLYDEGTAAGAQNL
jgi:hypothetical protein